MSVFENLSRSFPREQVRQFRVFVELLKNQPILLHHPEFSFAKEFIESFGGTIPPRHGAQSESQPTVEKDEDSSEMEAELESAESDVELEYDGVIDPDNDPPQPMGYAVEEVSEEDKIKSDAKKQEAVELFAQEKYDEAVSAYTEAILLNPTSAILFAKRGQCYLQLSKPNACIRDCTRALEINPDSASAYKFRGRAHRLLGNFVKAAEDLRNACKIDYDEQADEWLKEVTPNARKLEEHQRKYERKRLEKEVRDTRDRIRRMREEQMRRNTGTNQDASDIGADLRGMGDFLKIMNDPEVASAFRDPEVVRAFRDPEVAEAFRDLTHNPANILKYQSNPKINALLQKLSPVFARQMGFTTGGFPPFGGRDGGAGGSSQGGQRRPPSGADIDLD